MLVYYWQWSDRCEPFLPPSALYISTHVATAGVMKIWMPGTLTERKYQPTEGDKSKTIYWYDAEFYNSSVFGCSHISTANKGHSIHNIEENLTRTRDCKEFYGERRTQTCEWETSGGPCTTRPVLTLRLRYYAETCRTGESRLARVLLALSYNSHRSRYRILISN